MSLVQRAAARPDELTVDDDLSVDGSSVVDPALASARATVQAEAQALITLADQLDERFVAAVDLILRTPGRVVVTGLGKSGLVGSKIAATLASTGTPASFVHAADALHGDAGVLRADDVLLALSNSGRTHEVCAFASLAAERDVPVVALTGGPDSPLAATARVVLHAPVEREADPLDLAPTTSTTVALAIGDALAIALMQRRGFTADDFARNHPGGALGQALASDQAEGPA